MHGSPVSCQFSIPDDLWLVDIDSGQISQVIQNLIINAKHAIPGGGEIRITCINISDIRSETSFNLSGKAYIKITVQDNGYGITEKYLDKIFDPYFTTKQEGSGLGLAITHSIIRKHYGHIIQYSPQWARALPLPSIYLLPKNKLTIFQQKKSKNWRASRPKYSSWMMISLSRVLSN